MPRFFGLLRALTLLLPNGGKGKKIPGWTLQPVTKINKSRLWKMVKRADQGEIKSQKPVFITVGFTQSILSPCLKLG